MALHCSQFNWRQYFMISRAQLKIASFIVWTILSIIIFFILITPFFLSHDSILKLAPCCASPIKYNKECALCGMSRAFIAISERKISLAYSYNKAAIPTYTAFVLNEAFFVGLILMMCIKKSEPSRNSEFMFQKAKLINRIGG